VFSFVGSLCSLDFLPNSFSSSVSEMEAGKNKQAEIRKAIAFHTKFGKSSIPLAKVSQKRKQLTDASQFSKEVQGFSNGLD